MRRWTAEEASEKKVRWLEIWSWTKGSRVEGQEKLQISFHRVSLVQRVLNSDETQLAEARVAPSNLFNM